MPHLVGVKVLLSHIQVLQLEDSSRDENREDDVRYRRDEYLCRGGTPLSDTQREPQDGRRNMNVASY